MSLPGALSLVPELRAFDRQPKAERALLESEACWAYRFGSPVTLAPGHFALWVEIGQSLKLFGGWPPLAKALLADLEEDPTATPRKRRLGLAPTQACAYLLARSSERPRKPIRRTADIAKALAGLPLDLLPLDGEEIALLQGAGLRCIGQVLDIAPAELAIRIGPDAHRALDRLLGRTPEVWTRWEPPTVYRRRFEFQEPIDNTEALLFPVRGMAAAFVTYLKARNISIQRFGLRMIDTRKRVVLQPIGLLAPTQDLARLMLVVREQIDKILLEDPITEVILEAKRFEPVSNAQEELFAGSSSVRLAEHLTELKERLIARLGSAAVRQIEIGSDQRPEQATQLSGDQSREECATHPPRPIWLLEKPQRISTPTILSPAERIELGWWQGQNNPRDYHLIEDSRRRLGWAYRTPDAPQDWYLHGLWQ